ncbi:hypothetical protein BDV27DRAFT_150719 [Aspergillus caelatus]|uniref:Uncharacterized protein n=1 Tax=Aspergillus caelatus TaxID=61420 RepID=A0A5N6ZMS8_9EURO|nr:uncharacterized protein BDV27DRAFT_150719 [Aspergillus caelatus]KAE8358139.1 hypothetical protein BDV27DRAFT_150719 [Aspergillus caelatus]
MTKDGGDESPNHVGEWLLDVLPGGRQSFRIIGMEEIDKDILDKCTGHRVMACDDTLPVVVSYLYGCTYMPPMHFTFGVSAKGPQG